MTHAVISVDTEGRITAWDDGAEELFGHDRASVLGQPVDIIIPRHLRDAHWRGFRRAMAAPEVRDRAADLPVMCADGSRRYFAARLLVLSDAFGVALGATAIYTDSGSTGVRPFAMTPDEDA